MEVRRPLDRGPLSVRLSSRRLRRPSSQAGAFLTTEAPDVPLLRIGSTVPLTKAEGPGKRFAVWAQGCTIRCAGCFNPHLWGARGGRLISAEDLCAQVVESASKNEIEGITLLGGEPFEQAPAFAVLAEAVQQAGLSVMAFTGYELDDLRGPDAPEGAGALLAATDLLVDGPYRADSPDLLRPWVGSTNQEFRFLTDRYRHLEPTLQASPDRVEVRVSQHGEVTINGWATVGQLDALLDGVTSPVGRGDVR